MAATSNSRPTRGLAPVVVRKNKGPRNWEWLRLFPATILSVIFHCGVFGLLFFLSSPTPANAPLTADGVPEDQKSEELATAPEIKAEPKPPKDLPEQVPDDPFLTGDVNNFSTDPTRDFLTDANRFAEATLPGDVSPNEPIGLLTGLKDAPPISTPPIGDFGKIGEGGGLFQGTFQAELPKAPGAIGIGSGPGLPGLPPGITSLAGTPYGRSGATKVRALESGGGTKESEAAVAKGLRWLVRHQVAVDDKRAKWMLEDPRYKEKGHITDDVAATSFALLALLGSGYTHLPSPDNPFDKPIEKALLFLMSRQNMVSGDFGSGRGHHAMYSQGLATIVMCEAYALSKDKDPVSSQRLKKHAEAAIRYAITSQHDGGGWRYAPRQAGDLSVTGWFVMGLKSAQMAGLYVPGIDESMKKAQKYLDASASPNEGYGYTPGGGPTPTMTAVGLLCRQYIQNWGPRNPRMQAGVNNHLMKNLPTNAKNIYYYYYATQAMHHYGGDNWKEWNNRMREILIRTQDPDGNWSAAGDRFSSAGGTLMMTSLCLCTLEVYYRHLPLYNP